MDEAGIDMQVLSHANPGLQKMDAETAVRLARIANDRLAETVRAHPDRFAAFAAIPTPDPKAAADELDRAVTQLGFKGALINGTTNGVFFDDKRFWPICERAAALDVPLYLHPTMPHAAVIDTYYKDYAQDWPMLLRAAWGFTVETATQGVRMVLSGVFDAYPNLKIILGHLGEGLPFLLWRIDMGFARGGGSRSFRDVFCEHFYITTSGFFSNPALLCCVQEMGVDRIMFSVDYPFVLNKPGTDWLPTIPLCAEDKAKIASGNAVRIAEAIVAACRIPFVHPEEPTAADAIAAIGDELGVFDDWMDRYQFIIELGRKLPPFPDDWTNDAHRVPGCQSRVWMEGAMTDGRLFLAGISDAAIVSGLIALLLRVYSGRPPDEIVATDPVFLKDLGLLEALSTNRGNGIAAMARKIRELAALQRAA